MAEGVRAMSFEQSFKNLLPWEGGYSNDPGDDGGPTDLGVIQVEYNAERREEGQSERTVVGRGRQLVGRVLPGRQPR